MLSYRCRGIKCAKVASVDGAGKHPLLPVHYVLDFGSVQIFFAEDAFKGKEQSQQAYIFNASSSPVVP